MAKIISFFNHKGGVSKTTTAFNVAWMLSKKYRVLLVDGDPQCNLTGLILNSTNEGFEEFYSNNPNRNLKAALSPAFESLPRPIETIETLPVNCSESLFLVPGHINLSEYEITLGIAQELSSSIQALRNLPGSIYNFIDLQAVKDNIDYVIIDMNPSLGALNQNFLMISHYFIVPTAPDYFSKMAINSLKTVIPRWQAWIEQAQKLHAIRSSAYPLPEHFPRFLGTIIQKYRPRKGEATVGFQKWIDEINISVADELVPLLTEINMAFTVKEYKSVKPDFIQNYCLSLIPDFNTLIATSQDNGVPVYELTDEMFGHVGTVLEGDRTKKAEFTKIFTELTNSIIKLINA